MCGALQDFTGIRSGACMLLYAIVWVSLICVYWTEMRKTEVMGLRSPASPLAAQSSSGAAHLLSNLMHSTGARAPPSPAANFAFWTAVASSGSSARTNTNNGRCGSACAKAALIRSA